MCKEFSLVDVDVDNKSWWEMLAVRLTHTPNHAVDINALSTGEYCAVELVDQSNNAHVTMLYEVCPEDYGLVALQQPLFVSISSYVETSTYLKMMIDMFSRRHLERHPKGHIHISFEVDGAEQIRIYRQRGFRSLPADEALHFDRWQSRRGHATLRIPMGLNAATLESAIEVDPDLLKRLGDIQEVHHNYLKQSQAKLIAVNGEYTQSQLNYQLAWQRWLKQQDTETQSIAEVAKVNLERATAQLGCAFHAWEIAKGIYDRVINNIESILTE